MAPINFDQHTCSTTTPEAFTAARYDALRAWARGMYPLEAATELLIPGCGGRLAEIGSP